MNVFKRTCQYFGPDIHPRDFEGPAPRCEATDVVGRSHYCAEHYPLIYKAKVDKRKKSKKKTEFFDDDVVVTKVSLNNDGELSFNEVVI